MRQKSLRAVIVRLILFTLFVTVLSTRIVVAIQRPVAGRSDSYTAMFTDAGGLRTGDDVRMFGVAVGKVREIRLDGSLAEVRFTVQSDRPMYRSGTVAIRYQNLAGQRYLDVRQPAVAGPQLGRGETIGVEHTVASFDITTLFNGMEPVLAEFSPDALNTFMRNALAVIEGDGKAVGATLDAVRRLSTYVTDRQAVISLLLHNFEQVAEHLGGKSPETGILIKGLSGVFVSLQQKFDGLMDFTAVAPPVLGPLNNLLATLGFTEPQNPDLERDLHLAFPDPQAALDTLNRLPGLVQSLANLLPARGTSDIDPMCRSGRAELPGVIEVLVSGQRISICNG